jgi:hypothetical protein
MPPCSRFQASSGEMKGPSKRWNRRRRERLTRCRTEPAREMTSNVVHLPTCLDCKYPMRLVLVVGDKERGPVTRVLECVRCHATIYRPPAYRVAKQLPLNFLTVV